MYHQPVKILFYFYFFTFVTSRPQTYVCFVVMKQTYTQLHVIHKRNEKDSCFFSKYFENNTFKKYEVHFISFSLTFMPLNKLHLNQLRNSNTLLVNKSPPVFESHKKIC